MRLAINFQRVDPTKGGAETYVADLCGQLARAGHDVDLYAESWREDVLPDRIRCVRVEASGRTKAARIWSFAVNSERALATASYDCTVGLINTWAHDVLIPQGGVHEASLEANARRFPPGWRRFLYRLGKKANPKFGLYRAIEERQYDPARGARVVAVSRMVRGHLERFHRVPRPKIHVIPNAIDTGRLAVADPAATRAAFRKEYGLGEEDVVGLFAGHNFRLKGLPDLLQALAIRRQRAGEGPPIHLVVCGGGSLGPMRRLAARLGLADCVRLVGFLSDVRAGYHACDFFALPSYYDPCSLVVFEALACGLPVITTASNGAGELITPGREGFVVTAPDAHAHLADALDRMADGPARRVMAEHARRLGREQSFENHVARLLEVFEEVARSRGGATPHGRARLHASR